MLGGIFLLQGWDAHCHVVSARSGGRGWGDFKARPSESIRNARGTPDLPHLNLRALVQTTEMTIPSFETTFAVPMTCEACVKDISGSLYELAGTRSDISCQQVDAS